MRQMITWLLVWVMGMLSNSAFGQVATARKANFTDFKLENGLKVIIVPDSAASEGYLYATLLVDYPLVYEGEYKGISELVAKLLVMGTKKSPPTALAKRMRDLGGTFSSLGKEVGATASAENKEAALALLAEIVKSPSFPKPQLDSLKQGMANYIKATASSPTQQSSELTDQLIFGADHPYGERITLASLANIDTTTCRSFYQKYYRPVVSYLVLSGNIKPQEGRYLAEKYFGDWQSKGAMFAAFYIPAPLPQGTRVSFVHLPGAQDANVELGYHFPLKPGSKDELGLELLAILLNNHLDTLPWNRYPEIARITADPHLGQFLINTVMLRPEAVETAVRDMLQALTTRRKQLVSQEELAQAKAILRAKWPADAATLTFRRSNALSTVRHKLPRDHYDLYQQHLEAISPAQILELAQAYLLPGRAHVVVAGDQAIAPALAWLAYDEKVHYYTRGGVEIQTMNLELAREEVTASAVIEQYLQAIGGREKLLGVTDLEIIAEAPFANDKLTMTQRKKDNEQFYGQIRLADLLISETIFDGERAVRFQDNNTEVLAAEELIGLKELALHFPPLHYASMDYQLTVKGAAVINGKNTQVVEIISPSGRKNVHYFDSRTGLLIRSENQEGDKVRVTDFADYQGVNGIKFPHQVVITGFVQEPVLFTVKTVKINQGLTDDLFKVGE